MPRPLKEMPLYPSEAEIAEAVLGTGRLCGLHGIGTIPTVAGAIEPSQ